MLTYINCCQLLETSRKICQLTIFVNMKYDLFQHRHIDRLWQTMTTGVRKKQRIWDYYWWFMMWDPDGHTISRKRNRFKSMTFDTEKYTQMMMMEDYQLWPSRIYYDIENINIIRWWQIIIHEDMWLQHRWWQMMTDELSLCKCQLWKK